MDNTVYKKIYAEPPINKKEILRYAGVGKDIGELDGLIGECISELEGQLFYKVCYRVFPISFDGDAIDLGFCRSESRSLKINLEGCEYILLFAATVGMNIDRAIVKYSAVSPAKAFVFQAIGAERIESLCDVFCRDIQVLSSERGFFTRPRFSAGYGDFALEYQKEIFAALDCYRQIGVSLNDSLLMSPTKSVTAIIGMRKKA